MWQSINDFLGNIVLTTGVFLFARIVFNKTIEVSKIRLIFDLILNSIIYTIIMIYFIGTTKTFLMGIMIFLFVKDIFRENNSKTIFITIIYIIVALLFELLELFLVIEILNLNKDFCYNVFAGSIISNIIVQIMLLFITIFLKTIFIKLFNHKIENNTKIIIFSILTLICLLMFFYNIIREFRFNNNIYLYLISFIVLAIVLFSLIKQTIENHKLTNEYDKLLEFMTTYENEIEKQRILRHEIKNEFRTIRAKISDNQENKKIIAYIDEIVKDKYKVNQEKYAKFGYLPPNGIKGLCYFKVQEAEDKGINAALNISKRIKNSSIYNLTIKQQRDFGRILGVFLDNAIEASLSSEKKQLGIEAYSNLENEFRLIITNTYNNKIENDKIGKERFSTKGKNRGHGLLLAEQLINKNKIFESKTEIHDEVYCQTIIVKKEKSGIKN